MPFKDSPEGTTHFYNDGCGEKAHNNQCSCVCHENLRESITLKHSTKCCEFTLFECVFSKKMKNEKRN